MIKRAKITVHHFQGFRTENALRELKQNMEIARQIKQRFPNYEVEVLGDFKQPMVEVNGSGVSGLEQHVIERSIVELIARIHVATPVTANVY